MKITDPNLKTVKTSFQTKQVRCIQYWSKMAMLKSYYCCFLKYDQNEYPSTCSCDMQISNMCKTF